MNVLVSQANLLQLISVVSGSQAIGAPPLKRKKGGDGLIRPHERRVARMRIDAVGYWGLQLGLKVFILIHGKALRLGLCYVTAQALDLLFHLGMFRSLPDPLEVGLYLAVKLQAIASRAALEWVLYNIAP